MRAPTDNELVSAARARGWQNAYGELFERYQSRVYNYAYSIVGNPEEARDVAQEAFIRVFEALPSDVGRAELLGVRVSDGAQRRGRQCARPHALRRARTRSTSSASQRFGPIRSEVALLKEQQERTWRAAFELPEKHREILTLRELHDMSYQEIAERARTASQHRGGSAFARTTEVQGGVQDVLHRHRNACRRVPRRFCRCSRQGSMTSWRRGQRARVEEHLEQCAFLPPGA